MCAHYPYTLLLYVDRASQYLTDLTHHTYLSRVELASVHEGLCTEQNEGCRASQVIELLCLEIGCHQEECPLQSKVCHCCFGQYTSHDCDS